MNLIAKYRDLSDPLSFGGRNLAYRYHKGKREDIERDLAKIPAYYFHREAKKPRVYNPIYVYRTRELMQADLINLMYLQADNSGYKYILVVVDSFSRYAWVRSLKTTSAKECLAAFKDRTL